MSGVSCNRCGGEKPWTEEHFSVNRRRGGIVQPCRKCAREIKDRYKKSEKGVAGIVRYRRSEKTRSYYKEYKAEYRVGDKHRAWQASYNSSERKLESQRKWRELNASKVAVASHRRRHRVRLVAINFRPEDWDICVERFGGACAACGSTRRLSQDHWIPLSKGGAYDRYNIVTLCSGRGGCNNSKADRDPRDWVVRKFGERCGHEILAVVAAYFLSLRMEEGDAA